VADESYLTRKHAVMENAADLHLWDVIVVGAGPAGCAAAYDLATTGLSVLLLDKNSFPRPKACAGGLTVKAVQALRYSITPVVKETVRCVLLAGSTSARPAVPPTGGNSSTIMLKSREPICVMTVRAEFDEFCLRTTMAAGARFQRISSLRGIVRVGDTLHLLTAGETYRARFLVGADGASGQVRSLCAPGAWFSQGFALEVRTATPRQNMDLTFDFASVRNGYAWIFPKKDHLNVGVYSPSSAGDLTRHQLLTYVRDKVGTDALDQVTGQYLGLGAARFQNEYVQPELRDRVLLVGDAGGFVDALTGEGIYGALVSGQAAARAILSETRGDGPAVPAFAGYLDGYRQTLRFSSRAAAAFYANPERGFRVMRLPFLRRSLVRTYTHGLSVKSLAVRLALAAR
jgi:geranylgeranyl reductase family protein